MVDKSIERKTDDVVPSVKRTSGIHALKQILRKDPSTAKSCPMLPTSNSWSSEDAIPISDSDASPATPRQMRSVSFSNMESPSNSSHLSLGEATVHDMMARIETLNDRLSQASVDLSGEKALRKKKERNLIKLARELNRRSSDSQIKVSKIDELEDTVAELQMKLKAADNDNRAREREVNEAQEKYRSVCRDYDAHLAQERTKNEAKVSELHDMVLKANTETERLRAKLAAFEGEFKRAQRVPRAPVKTSAPPPPASGKTEKRLLRAALATTLAVAAARYFGLTSMESVCGPAQPGMTFATGEDAIMEAPWWAPDQVKEEAFRICGERTRSRLVWSEGKLSRYSLEPSKDEDMPGEEVLDWQRRAHSIETGDNQVSLLNKKGKLIDEIELN